MATGKTPPTPSATTSASGGNVRQLHKAAPAIEPEDGWNVRWHGYTLRSDGTDEGRLVKLIDVVLWLSVEKELPIKLAVDRVCSALEGNSPPLLYRLCSDGDITTGNGYAEQAFGERPSVWEDFMTFTDQEAKLPRLPRLCAHLARSMRTVWLMPRHEMARLVNVHGEAVEYDERQSVCEWLSDRYDPYSCIAVPFAVAHALWGWGRPVGRAVVAGEDAGSEIDAPLWLSSKGLNVAWLKWEFDRFERDYPKRGMGKLLEFLAQKGVAVPNKDKAREVHRALAKHKEASSSTDKATPFTGLGDRKTAGKR